MDEREKHILRVFETALFFRDMHEEDNDGQTTAIELLKPLKSTRNTVVRQAVLHDFYKRRGLSLADAAVELAKGLPDDSERPPFTVEDIESDLRAICVAQDRPFQSVKDQKEVIIRRAFLRAARYIRRIPTEGVSAHSRVVERFIPEEFVPRGKGKDGPGHGEHVVPCVLLLKECIARFAREDSLDQVADFLRQNVVIVDITEKQREYLDGSPRSGGLGLKTKMPHWWKFDSDCIFQRLHCAEIEFDPPRPAEFTPCRCGARPC